MKLTLGFSPCPNDTFIFDALVNNKIDNEGIHFEPVLEDVETLNKWAMAGKLDVTKLSFPALFQASQIYAILSSGSALGNGVGPLLISKEPIEASDIREQSIAIPGWHTTANFLLSFAFPQATNRTPLLFSAIEDAVLNKQTAMGLIIHENRFTYARRGLHLVQDLGAYWEAKTGLPIPLGCIAIKRTHEPEVQQKVNKLIQSSLEYAFAHYPQLPSYVTAHAQEMEPEVMQQHIDLYVNKYSLNLGTAGKKAIKVLHEVYCLQQGTAQSANNLFVD